MDTNTMIVVVVIVLVVVVVIGIILSGGRGKGKVKVGDMSAEFDGSTPETPGAQVVGSESSEGGALAEDGTGKGAVIQDTKVKDDLIASNRPPSQDDSPKA